MFAVWTQSWLPTAMIINYIIQLQSSDALGQLASGGVNIDNMYQFYDTLATRIGLASELFAMTPMISYALLTGGVQAMTSLAGAMNQKDHFSEKDLAPGLISGGELTKAGNLMSAPSTLQEQRNSSGEIGDNYLVRSGGVDPFKQFKFAQSGSEEIGAATSNVTTAQTTQQVAAAHAIKIAEQKQGATAFNETLGRNIQASDSVATKDIASVSASLQKGLNLGTKESAEFTGMVGVGIASGLSPVQLQAALNNRFGAEKAKTISANFAEDKKRSNENGLSLSKVATHGFSEDFKTTFSKSVGVDDSKTYNDAASQTETAQDQLTYAQKRSVAFSSEYAATSDKPAALLLSANRGNEAMAIDSIKEKLDNKNKDTNGLTEKDRFERALNQKKVLGATQGQSGGVSNTAWALEALGEQNQTKLQNFMMDSGLLTGQGTGDGGVAGKNAPVVAAANIAQAGVKKQTLTAPSPSVGADLHREVQQNYRPASLANVNSEVNKGELQIKDYQNQVGTTGQLNPSRAAEVIGGPNPTDYENRATIAANNAGVTNANGSVSSGGVVKQVGSTVVAEVGDKLLKLAGVDADGKDLKPGENGRPLTPEDVQSSFTGGVAYNPDATEQDIQNENPSLNHANDKKHENKSSGARALGNAVRNVTGTETPKTAPAEASKPTNEDVLKDSYSPNKSPAVRVVAKEKQADNIAINGVSAGVANSYKKPEK